MDRKMPFGCGRTNKEDFWGRQDEFPIRMRFEESKPDCGRGPKKRLPNVCIHKANLQSSFAEVRDQEFGKGALSRIGCPEKNRNRFGSFKNV
jgi:hypothetical protein